MRVRVVGRSLNLNYCALVYKCVKNSHLRSIEDIKSAVLQPRLSTLLSMREPKFQTNAFCNLLIWVASYSEGERRAPRIAIRMETERRGWRQIVVDNGEENEETEMEISPVEGFASTFAK